MIFAHDTERALVAAAALVNTAPDGRELLPDLAALDEFADAWHWTGSRAHDSAELAAVQRLRPILARLWDADEATAVAMVNRLLVDGHALPQLVTHDDWGYHVHATTDEAPLAERMAVEAAMALLDVIREKQLDRLLTCSADDCDNVYADLSKNRSRRFCSVTCGNRMNVAAYRQRQR